MSAIKASARYGVLVSFVCAMSAGVLACGNKAKPDPTVSSVSVTGSNTTTVPGQTVQLTATANMSDNTTRAASTATWTSSNNAVATVSTTGLVTAVAVGDANISAQFQSVTGSLPVAIKVAIARFTVSGPGGNDVCRLLPNTNGQFDCTFNASTSLGSPTGYQWTYTVGTATETLGPPSSVTVSPLPTCGFFGTKAPQIGTTGAVQMIVRLRVSKAQGTSDEVSNQNVTLRPQNQCGYGF